jgi:hypothetical protein
VLSTLAADVLGETAAMGDPAHMVQAEFAAASEGPDRASARAAKRSRFAMRLCPMCCCKRGFLPADGQGVGRVAVVEAVSQGRPCLTDYGPARLCTTDVVGCAWVHRPQNLAARANRRVRRRMGHQANLPLDGPQTLSPAEVKPARCALVQSTPAADILSFGNRTRRSH